MKSLKNSYYTIPIAYLFGFISFWLLSTFPEKRNSDNESNQKLASGLVPTSNSGGIPQISQRISSDAEIPSSWNTYLTLIDQTKNDRLDELWDKVNRLASRSSSRLSNTEKIELHLTASRLASESPMRLLTEAVRWRAPAREIGLSAALQSLVLSDPSAVLQWFDEGKHQAIPGGERAGLLASLGAEWGKSDFESGLKWLSKLDVGEQMLARGALLDSLVKNQRLDDALQLVKDLPNSGARTSGIQSVAQAWAEEDPPTALAWANSLEGEERSAARTALYTTWAADAPAAAAQELTTESNGDIPPHLSMTVSQAWARQSVFDAAVWVTSLPPSDGKTTASRYVSSEMAHAPTVEIENWLNSLDDAESRDASLALLSTARLTDSGEQASVLAGFMAPSQQRDQLLSRSLQLWSQSAPQEALNWATTSEVLSDAERERWIRLISR